ncbi:Cro/CI family transcriptional regulator [Chitinibacter sp. GC72]|uniref:Cro/CI family transcriptional regulator n=1 Tax=Chitinibacter sp. GC72 TaxID=1526917 RepID=UPI0018DF431F
MACAFIIDTAILPFMKKETVIAHFGGQRKTAEALGVKQPTVCAWPDLLPYSVLGRIAVHQPIAWRLLCAGVDWAYLRGTAKNSTE